MNVTGPAPIAIVQRYDNTDLVLRMNQRIAAEVLQVSGDRVVLSVNGVQIVARLTSSEQAAQLIERRLAQFVVKDTSSTLVTLQLLPHMANPENITGQQIHNLIQALLQQAGLPVNVVNVTLARALLEHGLPVNSELIQQLNQTLDQIQNWGEKEAQAGAFFIAEGFVLSPQAIQLFVQQLFNINEVIESLITELRKFVTINKDRVDNQIAEDAIKFLLA
ncbi:MAG: hypothetical protein ACPL6F_03465, partial [Anaerolineales bacterium]